VQILLFVPYGNDYFFIFVHGNRPLDIIGRADVYNDYNTGTLVI